MLLVTRTDTQQQYAMKVLKKDFLIRTRNVTYTKTERDILRYVAACMCVAVCNPVLTLAFLLLCICADAFVTRSS